MAIPAFDKAMKCSIASSHLTSSLKLFAAMATERTIRDWIKGWRVDEDGFYACNSGTNRARGNLEEPDVKSLCTKWWMDRDNAPHKGELILLIFCSQLFCFLLCLCADFCV